MSATEGKNVLLGVTKLAAKKHLTVQSDSLLAQDNAAYISGSQASSKKSGDSSTAKGFTPAITLAPPPVALPSAPVTVGIGDTQQKTGGRNYSSP